MSDFFFPNCDPREFSFPIDDYDSVMYHLQDSGYNVKLMAEFLNKDKKGILVKEATNILNELIENNKWVVFTCNRIRIMQALAKVVPITFALSEVRAPLNISSEKLIELFSARKPQDDWRDDPAGEALHKINKAALLVWENVDFPAQNTRYFGKFAELLSARLTKSVPMPVLFTATSPVSADMTSFKKTLYSRISAAVGSNALSIIDEMSKFIDFQYGKEEPAEKFSRRRS
jgi:hypothetical protein